MTPAFLRAAARTAAACAFATLAAGAQARPLVVANFGGANAAAQSVAFQQPFARQQGVQVNAVEYTGDLAAIRTMVTQGNVAWDIAEVESTDLAAGCEAGLQLAFSKEIPYGPTHFNAILQYDNGRRVQPGAAHHAVIDLSMVSSDLPSAPGNLRKSLAFDAGFWTRHGALIDKRFNEALKR